MTALLLTPAVLSALVLAAHFMRAGRTLLVLFVVALIPLLLVPRAWARRVAQALLLAGAAEWVRTLVGIARYRSALGEPYLRMAIILGGVALVAVLAAALLEAKRVRLREQGRNTEAGRRNEFRRPARAHSAVRQFPSDTRFANSR